MTDERDNDPFSTGAGLDVLSRVSGSGGEALIGRELGDYRITALIAEGGMSRVYRAERTDGSFERDVAIKVSPASGLSREFRERFLREQGMLAGLNHPNICQLYDAQVTEEGWPYIVMELVDGVPVDEWCRERTQDREAVVRLMIGIADALAYAHARLIVHRDIKPSNVLVNADGRPKLLDFGIAKLLEPDVTALTRLSPMTPRCASPEQLLGDEVTIGSDIYQLGLLFCEMLTGEALNPDQTLSDAIQRAASKHAVPIPADLRRRLPRDLLLVIEQCLRVAPEERYSDANALKRDLEAWLGGFPVSAAGQGAAYRFRKLVARNRPATLITVISTAAIISGSLWYTYSLAEARSLAERRAETSNRMLQTMSQLISDTFSGLIAANAERQVGGAVYIESVLRETVTVVQSELATEPAARAELLRVQGTIEMVLGDYGEAAETLEAAYRLTDAAESPSAAMQILLDRTEAAARSKDMRTARQMLTEIEPLLESHDFSPTVRARYHHQGGQLLQLEGEFAAAVEEFERALELLENPGADGSRLMADTHYEMAFAYSEWQKHEDALAAARRAVAVLEETESPMSHLLIDPLRQIGWSNLRMSDFAAAGEAYSRAMEIATANFGDTHPLVGTVHDSLGALAYYEARFGDAIRHYEEHLRILRVFEGEDSRNQVTPLVNLGLMYVDTGRMAEAGENHRLALAATDPSRPEDRNARRVIMANEARRLSAIGDHAAAAELHGKVLDLTRKLLDDDSFEVVEQQSSYGLALLRAGRPEQGRREFEESLRRYGEIWGFDGEGYAAFAERGWPFDLARGDLDAAFGKLRARVMERVEEDNLDVIYWAEQLGVYATLCLRKDDLACARQALDWAALGTATAPEHPWSYFVQVVEAEYWQRRGELDRARRIAAEALSGLTAKYPLHEERIGRARIVLDR
ncbi:protein kinase domain-containing protein [Lentisalinibacter salinarum]|uniref:protein kinase domain-containing protein n=1 Tax=Lentisalinibacter salinarum TaxID=2992239 RepID=UPI00386E9F3E